MVKQASADSTRWYGDTARLRQDTYLELRDASHFGTVTDAGAGSTTVSLSTEQACVMNDQSGISKAVGYDVESHPRA